MGGNESGRRLQDLLERFAQVTVDSRGRISIPRRFMDRMGIDAGDRVYVKLGQNRLEIYTSSGCDDALD